MPIESVGWYVAWRKRKGIAAARARASVAASPAKACSSPSDGRPPRPAEGSGSAVTVRTVDAFPERAAGVPIPGARDPLP